jgi:hypothetical protein
MLGTFLTISSEDVTAMLGYTSDLVEDLTPILLPIIGVLIGLLVFWAILNAIRGH